MRSVFAFALLVMPVVVACANESKPEDKTTEESTEIFLGPIAEDYLNALSAQELQVSSAGEARKLDLALGGLGLALVSLPLRNSEGADPSLPHLDHCDNSKKLSGGFLSPTDVTSAGPSVDSSELAAMNCHQLATALNASFYDLVMATQAQMQMLAHFDDAQDACTTAFETPSTSPRAAVGYQFLRRVDGEGLYLGGFNVESLRSTFEGGGAGSSLAVRGDTLLKVDGLTTKGRSMTQDVAFAALVNAEESLVNIHKTENVEVTRPAGEGLNQPEQKMGLRRHTVVNLNYGTKPEIREDSTFVRSMNGALADTWQLKVTAAPQGDGTLRVDLQVINAGGHRDLAFICAASES